MRRLLAPFRLLAQAFAAMRDQPATLLITTLCGVATFLSYPNAGLWPLSFVSLAPLLVIAEKGSVRAAFGWAMVTAVVTNLGGFYWITNLLRDFAAMPLPLALGLLLLLAAQQGLSIGVGVAAGRWLRLRNAGPAWLIYPLAITLAEALNPMIFPWALGHAQAPNLPLAQLAELGGVSLLTFVLAATNTLGADLIARPKRDGAPRRALIAAAILALLHLGGWLRMGAIDADIAAAPQLKVGVVEANIGVKEKHNSRLAINNLLIHQRASQQLEQQGAELIVWPETMFSPPRTLTATGRYDNRGRARQDARLGRGIGRDTTWFPRSDAPLVDDNNDDFAAGTSLADRSVPQRGFSTPLLTGLVTMRPLTEEEQLREPPGAGNRMVYNSAALLNAEGEVMGLADKKFLMPFSENFEVGRWLYYLTGVDLFELPGMGDFSGGTEPVLLTLPRSNGPPARIGALICYEDIIPAFTRELAAKQPNLLINITNDAWFGKTSEPALHFALARFRAIELRTTLIRSTNTGISGRVDPVGRLLEQTSLDGAETLLLDVPLMTARKTLYVLAGEWPAFISAVLLAWLLFAARRRATRS